MESKKSCITEYMKNQDWSADRKKGRRRYLHRLAQDSRRDPDIASKIGGMLIYNQVIEELLTGIVELSINYIKAEIWPVSVSLEVDLDKATFGKVIEYFTQFATVEPNRELILSHLKKFNIKRNQVVHDLFDIEIFGKESKDQVNGQLGEEIGQYQRAEQRIGDSVGLCLKGGKKQRRQNKDGGHGKVCRVASEFGAFVIGSHAFTSIKYGSNGFSVILGVFQLLGNDACRIKRVIPCSDQRSKQTLQKQGKPQ